MSEKKELGKRYKALRESLKTAEKDIKIAERALEEFGGHESFFIYLSFNSEVGTEELIKSLQAKHKKICVPRIEGKEMLSVPLTDKLEAGAYGILEPAEGEEEVCQVVFTPLLAADGQGYRLGYGGGYYDRYFTAYPKVIKVGLAYSGQLTDKLPHEEGDVPLDFLVTETGVYRCHRD